MLGRVPVPVLGVLIPIAWTEPAFSTIDECALNTADAKDVFSGPEGAGVCPGSGGDDGREFMDTVDLRYLLIVLLCLK